MIHTLTPMQKTFTVVEHNTTFCCPVQRLHTKVRLLPVFEIFVSWWTSCNTY